MSRVYPFSAYDKYMSLKFDSNMWLVIAYLLHPIILKISTIQLGRGTRSDSVSGLKDLAYPDDFSFFLAFAACIPVLVLILAYARRKPDASNLMRTLWQRGRALLYFATALSGLTVFVPFVANMSHSVDRFGWARLAIAAGILYYLATSKRVEDTFADFPVKSVHDPVGR